MSDKKTNNHISMLLELWGYSSFRRKWQFFVLITIMLFASVLEFVSLGSLIPFLIILTSPEKISEYHYYHVIKEQFKFEHPAELVFPLTTIFVAVTMLSAGVRLTWVYIYYKFSNALGADMGVDIFRKTLHQPYKVHIGRSSSLVVSTIMNKINYIIASSLLGSINIINSCFMILGITTFLILVQPYVAITAFCLFATVYLLIARFTNSKLKRYGATINTAGDAATKRIQEGLGGIREVIIDGLHEVHSRDFKTRFRNWRMAQANANIIANSPRILVEAVGIISITALAYFLIKFTNNQTLVVPILGVFALGAQKILPSAQTLYASWTQIISGKEAFRSVLDLLAQPMPKIESQTIQSLTFHKEIKFSNVSFRYHENSPYVLKQIDLTISKGSRIGIIGSSGSGKSTLVDLLMGLIEPNEGAIIIDETPLNDSSKRAWQNHISHVPQSIFLSDNTIENNIAISDALGIVNKEKVITAAKNAFLHDDIMQFPEQYQTIIGERGVRLSGGQRQRIGLARVFYKGADVLVLDEATSALDNETEKKLMQIIETIDRNLTIIMVAHRYTTLKTCDYILEVKEGQIVRKLSYAELMKEII